ncbi:fibropellin-1-like [Strongylocentrotus purpuratus]|uniref:EGF-like domain-containing protein n=1 Tax=Strongylocentrotus purpuratus TaxID=7668 RepID=A0A7M7PC48_STRPU|nr:fibropellin-1-like [Strongylocentrotus purpuratus]
MDVNECAIDTSLCNNGRCINSDGSYNCVCNTGFTLVNENSCNVQCDQSNCQNGGACTSPGQPCDCPAGFTGDLCQNAPQGLSDIAIIGIAFGVFGFVCVLVNCVCCVFIQGARRNKGTNSMLNVGRYEDRSRRDRGFYRNEGQYGVGQELYRLGGTDAPPRGDRNFRNIYLADGREMNNSVVRNPIHY